MGWVVTQLTERSLLTPVDPCSILLSIFTVYKLEKMQIKEKVAYSKTLPRKI